MIGAEFVPLGDAAVVVRVGETIHPRTLGKVRALVQQLEKRPFPGLVEVTPSFAAVTVFYDARQVMRADGSRLGMVTGVETPYERVCRWLRQIVEEMAEQEAAPSRQVEIPVCYGGEFGPDLAFVAAHNGLSVQEVIDLHASGEYLVHMIGFAPGFPYLGGMSERIAAPRKETPRLRIPLGSVGIAGRQTGVYPLETPGGWQLIGRTPKRLFSPDAEPPSLLQAGDIVRFYPITRAEYDGWKEGESR